MAAASDINYENLFNILQIMFNSILAFDYKEHQSHQTASPVNKGLQTSENNHKSYM